MNNVRMVVSMDCEPTLATTHSHATGPSDFKLSERAITGYFEVAQSYGLAATYFVHPETIIEQSDIFLDLARKGCCVGLHIHPWKYSLWKHDGAKYFGHFGQLSFTDQVDLLTEASQIWADAMGERPKYFRPGTFSANDGIFGALARCGFRGGSISAPGRVFREIRSVWSNTEPDPHRGNSDFRLVPGTLDVGNMPLTADYSKLLDYKKGRYLHADFRPDIDWVERYGIDYKTISQNVVTQIRERAPLVPVMNSITHNHYDYTDAGNAACQRFRGMLDDIFETCTRDGVDLLPATVHEVVDEVLGAPAPTEEFLYI